MRNKYFSQARASTSAFARPVPVLSIVTFLLCRISQFRSISQYHRRRSSLPRGRNRWMWLWHQHRLHNNMNWNFIVLVHRWFVVQFDEHFFGLWQIRNIIRHACVCKHRCAKWWPFGNNHNTWSFICRRRQFAGGTFVGIQE